MLRSCYESTWRFPGIGDVRGRYFFNDDAPPLEKWNYYGSRNWHQGDGTPWPDYGEREGRQTWLDGSFPEPLPDATLLGNDEQLEGLIECPKPDAAMRSGLPLKCWRTPPEDPSGTAEDGTGLQQLSYVWAKGGTAEDGQAVQQASVQYAQGGTAEDGQAVQQISVQTAEGGTAEDGQAVQQISVQIPGTGGTAEDGTAIQTVEEPTMAFKGVRLTDATAQNANTTTETAVSFGTETFDTSSFHDNTTNPTRITIPAGHAGFYLFGGQVEWGAMMADADIYLRIKVNGATYIGFSSLYIQGTNRMQVHGLAELAVGDYVELTCFHTWGAALSITPAVFWGVELGS